MNMAVQENTLAARILKLLFEEPGLNTRQIAEKIGAHYMVVRNKLYDLERKNLVKHEVVRRFVPGLTWIVMNEWKLTAEGKKWLKSQSI